MKNRSKKYFKKKKDDRAIKRLKKVLKELPFAFIGIMGAIDTIKTSMSLFGKSPNQH